MSATASDPTHSEPLGAKPSNSIATSSPGECSAELEGPVGRIYCWKKNRSDASPSAFVGRLGVDGCGDLYKMLAKRNGEISGHLRQQRIDVR